MCRNDLKDIASKVKNIDESIPQQRRAKETNSKDSNPHISKNDFDNSNNRYLDQT